MQLLCLNLKADLRELLDEWGNVFTFSPGKSWRNKVEIQGLMSRNVLRKKVWTWRTTQIKAYSWVFSRFAWFTRFALYEKRKAVLGFYRKYSIQSWRGVCRYWIHVGLAEFTVNALKSIWKILPFKSSAKTGLTGGPLAPFMPGVPGAPGGPGGPGGPCAPGSPCWETLSYNLPCWHGSQHSGHARHDKLSVHGKEAQRSMFRDKG